MSVEPFDSFMNPTSHDDEFGCFYLLFFITGCVQKDEELEVEVEVFGGREDLGSGEDQCQCDVCEATFESGGTVRSILLATTILSIILGTKKLIEFSMLTRMKRHVTSVEALIEIKLAEARTLSIEARRLRDSV